jgi:hypothetical protein
MKKIYKLSTLLAVFICIAVAIAYAAGRGQAGACNGSADSAEGKVHFNIWSTPVAGDGPGNCRAFAELAKQAWTTIIMNYPNAKMISTSTCNVGNTNLLTIAWTAGK